MYLNNSFQVHIITLKIVLNTAERINVQYGMMCFGQDVRRRGSDLLRDISGSTVIVLLLLLDRLMMSGSDVVLFPRKLCDAKMEF